MWTDTIQRDHAVVIGGSIAGLLTARVLSDHFARVTVLERDAVHDRPAVRKGQPQARHTHVVLEPARQLIQRYLPEVEPALLAKGAFRGDACANLCWFNYGGYRKRVAAGFDALAVTRTLLEYEVRKAVLEQPNIQLRDQTRIDDLIWDASDVCGVYTTQRNGKGVGQDLLRADLVVDASGRGSRLPKWLEAGGYEPPPREDVKINIRYTTRVYRRAGRHVDQPEVYFINGQPPADRLIGAMVPVEGGRWFLTLGGWHGHAAPTDNAGFLQAVKSLPTSDIFDVVASSEPLSDPVPFSYPSSRRFHYEALRRFPQGLLVLGDAVASFNPIYGQGMSSAALQVEALDAVLRERFARRSLWRRFFARQAKLVSNVWNIAVGEDFRYPETVGYKPRGTDLGNRYVELVHKAAQRDGEVARHVVEVICMRAAPSILLRPDTLFRVLRSNVPQPERKRLIVSRAGRQVK